MLGSMPPTRELEAEEAEQKRGGEALKFECGLMRYYLIWLTLVTMAPGNILMTSRRA